MATELRLEDRLDGARIVLILQENELWDIVNNNTSHPVIVLIVVTDNDTFDK